MDKRENRIAAFIESLPIDAQLGDCQTALLTTDMNFIGGDNGGDCNNDNRTSCYNVTNDGNCKNYANSCGKSKNRGACINTTAHRPPIGERPVKPPTDD